jgi:hypothetical protein
VIQNGNWRPSEAPPAFFIAPHGAADYDYILKIVLSFIFFGGKIMALKRAAILVVFCAIIPLSAVEQSPSPGAQAASSQAGMANSAENAQIRQMTARGDEAQALREDLKKMRALVRQMETNLAFVDTTQSPLKHQFQLEIDMWKTLIDQMERRAQGNSR